MGWSRADGTPAERSAPLRRRVVQAFLEQTQSASCHDENPRSRILDSRFRATTAVHTLNRGSKLGREGLLSARCAPWHSAWNTRLQFRMSFRPLTRFGLQASNLRVGGSNPSRRAISAIAFNKTCDRAKPDCHTFSFTRFLDPFSSALEARHPRKQGRGPRSRVIAPSRTHDSRAFHSIARGVVKFRPTRPPGDRPRSRARSHPRAPGIALRSAAHGARVPCAGH